MPGNLHPRNVISMLLKHELNKKDTNRHDNVNRGTAQAILILTKKTTGHQENLRMGKIAFPREEHTNYNFF